MSASRCARAKSSALQVSWAPAAPKWRAPFSARTRSTAARSMSMESRDKIRQPAGGGEAGLAYLSEDRKHFGLVTPMSRGRQCDDGLLVALRVRQSVDARRATCRKTADRLCEASQGQDAVGRPGNAPAVGRQPAEGRDRQVAAARLRHPLFRRADARHRRRRQGGNLQDAPGPGGGGQGHRRDLVRAGGGPAPVSPHHRDVRRARHGRARRQDGDAGSRS